MRYSVLLAVLVALSTVFPEFEDAQKAPDSLNRSQARSMVITRLGIVATEQTLASQAGAQVLARGGSAADAAIAANAVMGVMEPMMNGMGGDLFAIEWDAKSGKLSGLNASGWAPQKLTLELMKQKQFGLMPATGIYSVTVPGCVRGWEELHKKFGRLRWAELFQPAIYYAQNGFAVAELDAAYWKATERKIGADANGRRVYLVNGAAPQVGGVFRNPEYARALELVASQGPEAFYDGPIAKAILATSDRQGGVMTAADLADYKPEWVDPISTTYRGWTAYELPPNGQGLGALEMLNLMEHYPLPEWGSANPDAFQVKMEAQKLAYADLRRRLADPRFSKVPTAGLISKQYAQERVKLIDVAHARCPAEPGQPDEFGHDTTYLSVVDRDGNIVSLIQSLYTGFGSGVVVDNYGFALQNRGALFVLDPTDPNVLAPHKRPFHTIIPAFLEKGSLHAGFGIMGGPNQAQAHAQFVSNLVDYGMNLQAALEAPRFTNPSYTGCTMLIEARVPADIRQALVARGQQLVVRGDYSSDMGGGQAVMHDSASGLNYGASDPRKDGAAVPEPDPYFQHAPEPK